MPTEIQKIIVSDPGGVLLATKRKYCRCNLQVVPKLLPVTLRRNGSYEIPPGYAGYSSVNVDVPGKPEGTLSVSANGTYAAPEGTVYSSVEVAVPSKTERTLLVSENGEHVAPEGTVYSKVNVAVPGKEEMTLLITKNGTYTAPEGKVYSSIVVNIQQEGQEQIPDGNVITAHRGQEFSIQYTGIMPSVICPDWIRYYFDGGEIVFVSDTIGVGTVILYRDDKLVAQYIIKVIDENHVHTYTTTVVQPDCYNGGYTVKQCSCGDSVISDHTQKLGHLWGNPYYSNKFSTGYGYDCTRAGCGYYEDLAVPSCVHQYVFSKNVPATCIAGGYDSYICSLCGAEERRNQVAATEVHTYQNGTCTVCGAVETSAPPNTDITVNALKAFEIPYTGTITRVDCPEYVYYEDKGGKLECVLLDDTRLSDTITISLYNGETVVATCSATINGEGTTIYKGEEFKGDEWEIVGGQALSFVSFSTCSDNLEKFVGDDGTIYLRAIGTGVAYVNLIVYGETQKHTYKLREQSTHVHTWGNPTPDDDIPTGKSHTCTGCGTTEMIVDRTISVGEEIEFAYDDSKEIEVNCIQSCIECTLIDSGFFYIKGVSTGVGHVLVKPKGQNTTIDRYNIEVTSS